MCVEWKIRPFFPSMLGYTRHAALVLCRCTRTGRVADVLHHYGNMWAKWIKNIAMNSAAAVSNNKKSANEEKKIPNKQKTDKVWMGWERLKSISLGLLTTHHHTYTRTHTHGERVMLVIFLFYIVCGMKHLRIFSALFGGNSKNTADRSEKKTPTI